MKRLLGPGSRAAMGAGDGVAAVCFSADPARRVKAALAGDGAAWAMSRLPADGHAMLFVPPRGMAAWLALGGRGVPPLDEKVGALAAAARLSAGGGAEFFLSLPVGTLRRALGGER